jgi:N-ethylmaleimide reductase
MDLFSPLSVGSLNLKHRIVLAPMTRIRADENTLAPTELTALYYSQRSSSGGFLISEAVHISPEATPIWPIYQSVRELGGQVPGIWTEAQTNAWKMVTRAVHARGGLISCQLLHAGRVAQPEIGEHPLVHDGGFPIPSVCSSATPIVHSNEVGNDYNWDQKSVTPRALERHEIARICQDYQHAAKNALAAGFDAVELHAAHGYLIEQFLADGVNKRNDSYGGSVRHRCRILFEIIEALIDVVGPNRLGVRLSPVASNSHNKQVYFGVTHSNPESVYEYVVESLNQYKLAYLLLTEPRVGGLSNCTDSLLESSPPLSAKYRKIYKGVMMGAGGFNPNSAKEAIDRGHYDLIAFGRWFLSNPDLVARLKGGDDLNIYHRASFYGGGEQGYTDYPDIQALRNQPLSAIEQVPQNMIG